ncbi:hypothetical protein ACNVED_08050 [Legionella sp. D16C41]|uniref:hypothetical protein n=1 Tax=Legionella sp. D16C41 TaxID=3402688 RepID=UPI003AF90F35
MKKGYLLWLIILCSFLISLFVRAEDRKEQDVASWTQQVLLTTLSASYDDSTADVNEVSKNYYPAAWFMMRSFFQDKINEIKEKKITLHPKPLTAPKIVYTGYCGNNFCWRINQQIYVPELGLNIDFSVLLIKLTADDNHAPYRIQSLNIKLSSYKNNQIFVTWLLKAKQLVLSYRA